LDLWDTLGYQQLLRFSFYHSYRGQDLKLKFLNCVLFQHEKVHPHPLHPESCLNDLCGYCVSHPAPIHRAIFPPLPPPITSDLADAILPIFQQNDQSKVCEANHQSNINCNLIVSFVPRLHESRPVRKNLSIFAYAYFLCHPFMPSNQLLISFKHTANGPIGYFSSEQLVSVPWTDKRAFLFSVILKAVTTKCESNKHCEAQVVLNIACDSNNAATPFKKTLPFTWKAAISHTLLNLRDSSLLLISSYLNTKQIYFFFKRNSVDRIYIYIYIVYLFFYMYE